MGREDFEVNSRMLQLFNQYRIDQTTISYRCYGGIVYIEGLIKVEGNPDDGVKPEVMDTIHRAIRGMKHVKRVKFDLINMTQAPGGGWVYTKTVRRDEGKTWEMKGEGGGGSDQKEGSS